MSIFAAVFIIWIGLIVELGGMFYLNDTAMNAGSVTVILGALLAMALTSHSVPA